MEFIDVPKAISTGLAAVADILASALSSIVNDVENGIFKRRSFEQFENAKALIVFKVHSPLPSGAILKLVKEVQPAKALFSIVLR